MRYAYDFLMPIGSEVRAARAGQVLLLEEGFEDGTRQAGQENYINVEHSDGSIAAYVHLMKNGAAVTLGQAVVQGQLLGYSGDSGSSSRPHLHFHVQRCAGCVTAPITFRNTSPPADRLQAGVAYLATPF